MAKILSDFGSIATYRQSHIAEIYVHNFIINRNFIWRVCQGHRHTIFKQCNPPCILCAVNYLLKPRQAKWQPSIFISSNSLLILKHPYQLKTIHYRYF